MLSRTYEWYRIADAVPSDDTISKRRAGCLELVSDVASDPQLIAECVELAILGVSGDRGVASRLVELTVACIRNHQPAFPQDLSENALAVQACCAIAIGEVIGGDTAVPSRVRTLAAVLTKAATSVRPPVQERYLRAIIDTLSKSATDSLQQAAEAARRREPLSMVALDRIQPPTELGDFASFWEGARKAWRDFAAAAERQSQADREELEVLWWVYGGHSQTTGELLSKMKLGAAILCCGAEIADRVLVPPLSSTRDIVRRVV